MAILAAANCGGAGTAGSPEAPSASKKSNETADQGLDRTTSASRGGVFFPRWRGPVPGVADGGRLLEDKAGCIRIEIFENFEGEGTTPTVLWPGAWSAQRGEDGRAQIYNEKGRVLARVGEEVYLVGFPFLDQNPIEMMGVDDRTWRELLRRCPGRYYFAGAFTNRFDEDKERSRQPRGAETTSR